MPQAPGVAACAGTVPSTRGGARDLPGAGGKWLAVGEHRLLHADDRDLDHVVGRPFVVILWTQIPGWENHRTNRYRRWRALNRSSS